MLLFCLVLFRVDQSGMPDDGAPKFRAKIMGLSAVAGQNAAGAMSTSSLSSPPPPLASPLSSMNPANVLPSSPSAVLQLDRDERGNLLDQKDLVAQLQDELARRQVRIGLVISRLRFMSEDVLICCC